MSFFDLNNDSSTQESLLSCQECGKSDASQLKVCNQCLVTSYCSRECQREDWPLHRELCALIAANGDVGEKREALGSEESGDGKQGKAAVKRRRGQVAEGVTGIFFDRMLQTSPVEVKGSKDVRRYQFLHPAWPDVGDLLVVQDRLTLPLPSRTFQPLYIDETRHWSLFHYFQWEKFRSIGDDDYAELLREKKEYFEVEQASLLETYASSVVASELATEESLRANTDMKAVLRRIRTTLELRWPPRRQVETLRCGIAVIYNPVTSAELTRALLSTGDASLHLYTNKAAGDLFSLNPFTGRGADWLGRLLMERRDALNLQVTAPQEAGISQAGLVFIRDKLRNYPAINADDLKRPIGRAPLKIVFSTYVVFTEQAVEEIKRSRVFSRFDRVPRGEPIGRTRTIVGDDNVALEWLVKQFEEVWKEWRTRKHLEMKIQPGFSSIEQYTGAKDSEHAYVDDSDAEDNVDFSVWKIVYSSSITYKGRESEDF